MLCCVTTLSKNKLRTRGSRALGCANETSPARSSYVAECTLLRGGPFAHFSHPRKLGNQSERMITLRKQGPSGSCLSLPGSPTRGRWGLRCRWRRCDGGKSFPTRRAGTSLVLVCSRWEDQAPRVNASMCYVSPAISKTRPAILGESSSPTLFPRFWCIIRTEGPLSWRTGGS